MLFLIMVHPNRVQIPLTPNLPDAQTIISPNTPDLISDIIYLLKDLLDDGNYSEEEFLVNSITYQPYQNILITISTLSGFAYFKFSCNTLFTSSFFKSNSHNPPLTAKQDVLITSATRSKTPLLLIITPTAPHCLSMFLILRMILIPSPTNDSKQQLSKGTGVLSPPR